MIFFLISRAVWVFPWIQNPDSEPLSFLRYFVFEQSLYSESTTVENFWIDGTTIIQKAEHSLFKLIKGAERDSSDRGIVLVLIELIIDKLEADNDGGKQESMNIPFGKFEGVVFMKNLLNDDKTIEVGGEWASHEVENA